MGNPLSHTLAREFGHISILGRLTAYVGCNRLPIGTGEGKRRTKTAGKQDILVFIQFHVPAIRIFGAKACNSPLAFQRTVVACQKGAGISSTNSHALSVSEIGLSYGRTRHVDKAFAVGSNRVTQRSSRTFYHGRVFIGSVFTIDYNAGIGRLSSTPGLVGAIDSYVARNFAHGHNVATRGNRNALKRIVFRTTDYSSPLEIQFGIIFHKNSVHTATAFYHRTIGKLDITPANARNIIVAVGIGQRTVRLVGPRTTIRSRRFKLGIFGHSFSYTK